MLKNDIEVLDLNTINDDLFKTESTNSKQSNCKTTRSRESAGWFSNLEESTTEKSFIEGVPLDCLKTDTFSDVFMQQNQQKTEQNLCYSAEKPVFKSRFSFQNYYHGASPSSILQSPPETPPIELTSESFRRVSLSPLSENIITPSNLLKLFTEESEPFLPISLDHRFECDDQKLLNGTPSKIAKQENNSAAPAATTLCKTPTKMKIPSLSVSPWLKNEHNLSSPFVTSLITETPELANVLQSSTIELDPKTGYPVLRELDWNSSNKLHYTNINNVSEGKENVVNMNTNTNSNCKRNSSSQKKRKQAETTRNPLFSPVVTRSKRAKMNDEISANASSSKSIIKVDVNTEKNSTVPMAHKVSTNLIKSVIQPSAKKTSTNTQSKLSTTKKMTTNTNQPLSVKNIKSNEETERSANEIQETLISSIKVRIIPPTTVKAKSSPIAKKKEEPNDNSSTKSISKSIITRSSSARKENKNEKDSVAIFEAKLEEALRQGTTGGIGQSGGGLRNSPLVEPERPHSQWSPIRKKVPMTLEEASIQCTKSSVKNRRDEL